MEITSCLLFLVAIERGRRRIFWFNTPTVMEFVPSHFLSPFLYRERERLIRYDALFSKISLARAVF